MGSVRLLAILDTVCMFKFYILGTESHIVTGIYINPDEEYFQKVCDVFTPNRDRDESHTVCMHCRVVLVCKFVY